MEDFKTFKQKVDDLLMNDYLITIGDCTDDIQLKTEHRDGTTPQEFVDFIGEKYDLTKINNYGF